MAGVWRPAGLFVRRPEIAGHRRRHQTRAAAARRRIFRALRRFYLPMAYRPVAEFFRRSGKLGLMTVYRNEGRYDTSNVVFRDGEIVVYDKKNRSPEMRHIDYGLSLFKAPVFESYSAGPAVRSGRSHGQTGPRKATGRLRGAANAFTKSVRLRAWRNWKHA